MKKEKEMKGKPWEFFLSTAHKHEAGDDYGERRVVLEAIGLTRKLFANEVLANNLYVGKKLRSLSGKIYTLIDASIEEKTRREAMKDVLRGIFREAGEEVELEMTRPHQADVFVEKENEEEIEKLLNISYDEEN